MIQVLLESFPSYYAITHSPGLEPIVGGIVFGAFAVIPFVTAYSVLFDRIVDLRVVLRAALQYALARYTILIAAALAVAALVLMIYRERAQPLVAFVSGGRPLTLGALAALALFAFRGRHRTLALLDRRYFREAYDARQLLDRVMADALRSTSAADLESRLQQSTMQSMHADLALFVRDGSGVEFTRPDGTHPITTAGVLVTLIGGEATSLDVDPSDQARVQAAAAGRTAVAAGGGFTLITPLHAADID